VRGRRADINGLWRSVIDGGRGGFPNHSDDFIDVIGGDHRNGSEGGILGIIVAQFSLNLWVAWGLIEDTKHISKKA